MDAADNNITVTGVTFQQEIDTELIPTIQDWELLRRLVDEDRSHDNSQMIISPRMLLQSFFNEPPCICFACLAVATVVHTPRISDSISLSYYEKAKKSLVREESASLRIVQSMNLLVWFAYAKGQPVHAAISLNHQTQIALQIRLEIDPDDLPSLSVLSNEEKDERRRVFWSLYYIVKAAELQTANDKIFPSQFKSGTVKPNRICIDGSISPETPSFYNLSKLFDILEMVLQSATVLPNSLMGIFSNETFEKAKANLSNWRERLPKNFRISSENLKWHLKSSDRYGVLHLANFHCVSICILHRQRLYLSSKLLKNDSIFVKILDAIALSLEAAFEISTLCSSLIDLTRISEVYPAENNNDHERFLTVGFWKLAIGVGVACFEAAIVLWYYYCFSESEYTRSYALRFGISELDIRMKIRRHMEFLKKTLCLLETSHLATGLSLRTRPIRSNRMTPLLDGVQGMIAEMDSLNLVQGRQISRSPSADDNIENILLEMQTFSLDDHSDAAPVSEAHDPRVFLGLLGMEVKGTMRWRGRYEEAWREFWKKYL